MTKIDLGQLKLEIRQLNRHQVLYRVLKEELSRLDHWKLKGRGNPVKAFSMRGRAKGETLDSL